MSETVECSRARCGGQMTLQGSGTGADDITYEWWWCRRCGHISTRETEPSPHDGPSLF